MTISSPLCEFRHSKYLNNVHQIVFINYILYPSLQKYKGKQKHKQRNKKISTEMTYSEVHYFQNKNV